jgi:hypothetical protein
MEYLDIPGEEQLVGGEKCKKVRLVPDRTTRVTVTFAKLEFPGGAVTEETWLEVCADKSIYAVNLSPSDTKFLVPVTVEFKLNVKDISNEELERIRVVWISSDGKTEVIPHALVIKKNKVTVSFSIDHLSVFALIMV